MFWVEHISIHTDLGDIAIDRFPYTQKPPKFEEESLSSGNTSSTVSCRSDAVVVEDSWSDKTIITPSACTYDCSFDGLDEASWLYDCGEAAGVVDCSLDGLDEASQWGDCGGNGEATGVDLDDYSRREDSGALVFVSDCTLPTDATASCSVYTMYFVDAWVYLSVTIISGYKLAIAIFKIHDLNFLWFPVKISHIRKQIFKFQDWLS